MTKEGIREKYLYENGLSVNKSPVGERIQKATYAAMDEYAKQQVMELIKFIGNNNIGTVAVKFKNGNYVSLENAEAIYTLFIQSQQA